MLNLFVPASLTSPLVFVATVATGAQEYKKGYRALEIFDAEGREATPPEVWVWIVVATSCFAAGLFFVRRHSIARWVT